MNFVFQNETHCGKLNYVEVSINACGTWMCCERGEGEEEVTYHGRSRVKVVSSQGTICKGQLKGQEVLRMRADRSTQKTREVQDARQTLTQLPFFLLTKNKS